MALSLSPIELPLVDINVFGSLLKTRQHSINLIWKAEVLLCVDSLYDLY